MKHHPGFLKMVEEARKHIREISIEDYLQMREVGREHVLIDVREDREWEASHLPGALHIGKGVMERDIEGKVPDPQTLIVCYCGGGYRSALVCESLQKMGYAHVLSLLGGFREWKEKELPLTRPHGNQT
ncbi:MAG: rhodanese-like domain-containing protein [Verrucomicrobiae bacterium]|nr:rhodanese-like domain-containing protein [Verrucomicrobiae bacterium]